MFYCTMAFTLEQYEILNKAIGEGALEIKYGDKWIKYRSLTEMLAIKAEMEKDLGLNKIKGGRTFSSYSKDL